MHGAVVGYVRPTDSARHTVRRRRRLQCTRRHRRRRAPSSRHRCVRALRIGLLQHVAVPTHVDGNILNLVLSQTDGGSAPAGFDRVSTISLFFRPSSLDLPNWRAANASSKDYAHVSTTEEDGQGSVLSRYFAVHVVRYAVTDAD